MSIFRMRNLFSVHMLLQNSKFLPLPSTISHFSSIPDSDYATSIRKQSESKREVQVEIISTEMIKPSSSTPLDLRTYKLSSIDMLYPNIYPNFIFFYPYNDHAVGSPTKIDHDHQLLERRQVLKKSLSETLTKFYPFAGELKGDDECIDCNDRGAYYVEAKSNNCINEILNNPEENTMNRLLPFIPGSIELMSQTYMILVQVTIFACGGMSIGLFASHKMTDGYSYSTFANAWAAIARRSSTQIQPDFSAPSIFVPTNTQSIATFKDMLPLCSEQHKEVTKRFLFSRASLETLKRELEAPSRLMAVSGFLWKISMMAALASESSSNKSNCFILTFLVSLRTRSSPPISSIGNIVLPCFARHIISNGGNPFPGGTESIVKQIKQSADRVDSKFIENLKGEQGSKKVYSYMKELNTLSCGQNDYHTAISSVCNGGLYEIDYGWGKPIWISTGIIYPCALRGNIIFLMDTRSGDGIEAWIMSRDQKDMNVFECNQELLGFASLNPYPLQHLID